MPRPAMKGRGSMNTQYAVDNRTTDNVIVVTFTFRYEWIMTVLYDSRKTPYDIPLALADYPVESVNITDDLTIIEI